jgi:hypothetical protein
MPPAPAHVAIASLAAVLTQLACGGQVQVDGAAGNKDEAPSGSGGVVGSGDSSGGNGTGGSRASRDRGSADDWAEATVGTGATAGCPVRPMPSISGEDGCEIGESFVAPGGAGGEGDECVFVVAEGSTGTCGPSTETWGYCDVDFCDGNQLLSWQSECLPVR